MKIGIVGAGNVGTACAKAMLLRGSCHSIVLYDIRKDPETGADLAEGVVADLSDAASLCPPVRIKAGGYEEMADATVVVITAGLKERDIKEAVDPNDPKGRNRLVKPNADKYREIVPQIPSAAPEPTILVVTDPPDPLADVARDLTSNPILSSGTYLDTLRFRFQIAKRLQCHPASVDALVLGEHGLSQVYVWSSVRIGGAPILDFVGKGEITRFRKDVERAVRFANIAIINGTGASQHGIGIVTARIIEAMLCDEHLVAPIGKYHEGYGVTLSLPSVIRRGGVRVLEPRLSPEENEALDASAAEIRSAFDEAH